MADDGALFMSSRSDMSGHCTLQRSRSDISYAELLMEERRAQRRGCSGGGGRTFPPPLCSMTRTSYAQCPKQVPWVQLQPIRSNGRIVLQEVNRIEKQMCMQSIRIEGRLVLNLVRRGGSKDENSAPVIEKCAPQAAAADSNVQPAEVPPPAAEMTMESKKQAIHEAPQAQEDAQVEAEKAETEAEAEVEATEAEPEPETIKEEDSVFPVAPARRANHHQFGRLHAIFLQQSECRHCGSEDEHHNQLNHSHHLRDRHWPMFWEHQLRCVTT